MKALILSAMLLLLPLPVEAGLLKKALKVVTAPVRNTCGYFHTLGLFYRNTWQYQYFQGAQPLPKIEPKGSI